MRTSLPISLSAASAALFLIAGSAFASQEAGPVVSFGLGDVEASIVNGVENFFGIPYAAPPIGNLRWQPPQPASGWENVRDGSEYGAACPQGFGLDSLRIEDENCLFINVQRPEGTTDTDGLPVVVFIHGGGYASGSGNNENLDAMVRENNIIGVTMNYRLGNLGFLAHPALADENGDTGNYGLMDQRAALEWVQDNIGQFGGDPQQVTIAGESAGGRSVCTFMTMPAGEGLFSGAIMMSPSCADVPKAKAEATGERIATSLGCEGEDTAACLRNLPVAELLDAPEVFRRAVSGTSFIPERHQTQLETGSFAKVPVLIGSTRDEGRSFQTNWETHSVPTYDKEQYEALVHDKYGEDADMLLNVYRWPDEPTRYTGTYLVAEVNDFSRVCNTNTITEMLAAHTDVWAYEFAPSGGSGWFEVPGYIWGAGHATELPYIIPNRGNFAFNASQLGREQLKLADLMLSTWGAFVRSGSPNAEDAPNWFQYVTGEGPFMSLRESDRTTALPIVALRAAHYCDVWDRIAN